MHMIDVQSRSQTNSRQKVALSPLIKPLFSPFIRRSSYGSKSVKAFVSPRPRPPVMFTRPVAVSPFPSLPTDLCCNLSLPHYDLRGPANWPDLEVTRRDRHLVGGVSQSASLNSKQRHSAKWPDRGAVVREIACAPPNGEREMMGEGEMDGWVDACFLHRSLVRSLALPPSLCLWNLYRPFLPPQSANSCRAPFSFLHPRCPNTDVVSRTDGEH